MTPVDVGALQSRVKTEHSIRKPQHAWIQDIDNSYNQFIPVLPKKEHFVETAGLSPQIQEAQEAKAKAPHNYRCLLNFGDYKAQTSQSLPNPYKAEIEAFDSSINTDEGVTKVPSDAQLYKPLEETPFTFVDSEEKLGDLKRKLEASKEIAVDLEHHDHRSYLGLTCLMQISTREEDFVVDTIALKKQIGGALRGVFDDPDIVKVLHGADRDVEWLQRDFGIYVVNMFDTGQAARVLRLPAKGLAYLLQHHCGVTADKTLQRADWRVRPLPEEMLKYAREDTHYLLYIYDCLRK